jgi:hypothetical protein
MFLLESDFSPLFPLQFPPACLGASIAQGPCEMDTVDIYTPYFASFWSTYGHRRRADPPFLANFGEV